MIGVYAICRLQEGKNQDFEAIARELIEKSRQDKGCISYHCGKIIDKENVYAFTERWESQADLQLHMEQPHFAHAAKQLATVLAADLEISVLELL